MNIQVQQNGNHPRSGNWQRWALLAGGSGLALLGLSRRSKVGIAIAAAGGALIAQGARNGVQRSFHVERSVTIMKSPEELFQFWRNLANLPRFMSHLQEVRVSGDRWSHWVTRGPAGTRVSWDAEIVDEKPNQWIIWRSVPGSAMEHSGSVQFRPAPGDRGTEVIAALQINIPGGRVGSAVATLFGEHPDQQIREDLRHFKQLMEAGEVPTTHGQSSGRRSALVSLAQRAARDPEPAPIRRSA